MYIAIQAQNISAEKRYHNYYKLYKRRVRAIMRQLVRSVNRGQKQLIFEGKCGKYLPEYKVFQQISEELKSIGYDSYTYENADKNGYELLIRWDRQENKNG